MRRTQPQGAGEGERAAHFKVRKLGPERQGRVRDGQEAHLPWAPGLLVTEESPLNAPPSNKGEAAARPPAHTPGPTE